MNQVTISLRRKRLAQGSLSMSLELAHLVLPVGLSFFSTRYGWETGPSWWNVLGIALVIAGSCILTLAVREHFKRLRSFRTMSDDPPDVLIQTGPYRFTRNPIYLADMMIWLGWSVFFGSLVILLGFAILAVALISGVPLEEKGLQKWFGETYLEYKNSVPRWLGRGRQSKR